MASPYLTTVTGDIPADQLGATLAHEHLYCDISPFSGRPDNRIMDVPLVSAELAYFLRAGGRSIIEVTPDGIGRNAPRLREISERSGVSIVSGIAFYTEDTCRLSQMHQNGGRGYDYVWNSFLPRLRQLGVTDDQIHTMLVEVPRTFLARSPVRLGCER